MTLTARSTAALYQVGRGWLQVATLQGCTHESTDLEETAFPRNGLQVHITIGILVIDTTKYWS
jgi:hypothetical protein